MKRWERYYLFCFLAAIALLIYAPTPAAGEWVKPVSYFIVTLGYLLIQELEDR
jgi:hypothetical protein